MKAEQERRQIIYRLESAIVYEKRTSLADDLLRLAHPCAIRIGNYAWALRPSCRSEFAAACFPSWRKGNNGDRGIDFTTSGKYLAELHAGNHRRELYQIASYHFAYRC
jgi:hypothetical protein